MIDLDNPQKTFSELTVTGGAPQAINAANELHAYVGMSAGESSTNIEQHTGEVIALAGATYATANGGASTQITGVAHNREVDDIIVINGCSTAGYNGIHIVEVVGGANDFTIDVAFIDDPITDGFFQHPDHFCLGVGTSGTYQINCSASGSIGIGQATCEFGVYENKVLKHKIGRKFSNASDIGAWALTSLSSLIEGDDVWITMENLTNANDLDIDEMSFNIHRL